MQNISCLAVDPKAENASLIREACRTFGISFSSASNISDALDAIQSQRFDIIFIDLSLAADGTSDFLKEVEKHLPLGLLVLTGEAESAPDTVPDDNVFAFLSPPLRPKVLALLLRQMLKIIELGKEVNLLQSRMALDLKDPETGVHSDAYLRERIAAEFKRAARYVIPLSVLFIEIRGSAQPPYDFRGVKECAKLILKQIRGNDVLVKEDEAQFLVLLPDTGKKGALMLAERIRTSFKTQCGSLSEWFPGARISLGVASYPEDGVKNESGLLQLASRALQHAKSGEGDLIYSFKNIELSDIQDIISGKKKFL